MNRRADNSTVQKGSIQLLRFRIKFGMTVLVKFGMTVLELALVLSELVLGNWLLISVE